MTVNTNHQSHDRRELDRWFAEVVRCATLIGAVRVLVEHSDPAHAMQMIRTALSAYDADCEQDGRVRPAGVTIAPRVAPDLNVHIGCAAGCTSLHGIAP